MLSITQKTKGCRTLARYNYRHVAALKFQIMTKKQQRSPKSQFSLPGGVGLLPSTALHVRLVYHTDKHLCPSAPNQIAEAVSHWRWEGVRRLH